MLNFNAKIKDTKKKVNIKCQKCSKEGRFPVFIKYVRPVIFGLSLSKFHTQKIIICPHCGEITEYKK